MYIYIHIYRVNPIHTYKYICFAGPTLTIPALSTSCAGLPFAQKPFSRVPLLRSAHPFLWPLSKRAHNYPTHASFFSFSFTQLVSSSFRSSYFGHSGPVYKLRWSPFCANTFLSCSADWTIKLWSQEASEPLFSFLPSADYVADVCWAPDNSTIFASVCIYRLID